jgi:hypothetical protein
MIGIVSSCGFHRVVDHQGSRQSGWYQVGRVLRLSAQSPTAAKQEEGNDSSSNHGPWNREIPVVELLGLGLQRHLLEFVDQRVRVELPGDPLPELLDRFRDLFVFWLLEELSDRPGPVQPFGVDLGFFSVISGDEVIHCSNVAAWTDPDCFA